MYIIRATNIEMLKTAEKNNIKTRTAVAQSLMNLNADLMKSIV